MEQTQQLPRTAIPESRAFVYFLPHKKLSELAAQLVTVTRIRKAIGWASARSDAHRSPGVILPVRLPASYSIHDYNRFCIRDLAGAVESALAEKFGRDFDTPKATRVFTIHDDSGVHGGSSWDDRFAAYDYIGAPWHDMPFSGRGLTVVGNSGFSIRSLKLLREVARVAKQDPSLLGRTPIPHTDGGHINAPIDDILTCVSLRQRLVDNGLRFASWGDAARFSFETWTPEGHNPESSFGWHGSRTQQTAVWTKELRTLGAQIANRYSHELLEISTQQKATRRHELAHLFIDPSVNPKLY